MIREGGFVKLDSDFILMLHCNCMSIVHRFRYNEPFMFAGNDVTAISSLGALQVISDRGFWKGDPDFILVLHCNYMSIVHRFRYNELFMFAGNDVTAISSLGGASGNFWLRILKGRPRLYIHVQLTLFVYLERFRRYSTFFVWLGFPYWGRNCGGFGAKWPPKTSN